MPNCCSWRAPGGYRHHRRRVPAPDRPWQAPPARSCHPETIRATCRAATRPCADPRAVTVTTASSPRRVSRRWPYQRTPSCPPWTRSLRLRWRRPRRVSPRRRTTPRPRNPRCCRPATPAPARASTRRRAYRASAAGRSSWSNGTRSYSGNRKLCRNSTLGCNSCRETRPVLPPYRRRHPIS